MKYGHFDDAAREYVIETPQTPYPWINYLGSERFFGLISQTSGGYCFYRDARLRRADRAGEPGFSGDGWDMVCLKNLSSRRRPHFLLIMIPVNRLLEILIRVYSIEITGSANTFIVVGEGFYEREAELF